MKKDSFWSIIKADILRYTGSSKAGVRAMIKNWWINDGFLVVFIILFRIGQKIIQLKIPLLPTLINRLKQLPLVVVQ